MLKIQVLSKNHQLKSDVIEIVNQIFRRKEWGNPIVLSESHGTSHSEQAHGDFLFVDMSCICMRELNNFTKSMSGSVNIFLIWKSKIHSYFLTQKEINCDFANLNYLESKILSISQDIHFMLKFGNFDYEYGNRREYLSSNVSN
ncbi:hypothetical protein [Yersinia enterocolitica]|uniref:hypothetical protein n=1 Tax=Yersinia enterocolitica TaxID=630 RepID=UPI003CFC5CCD